MQGRSPDLRTQNPFPLRPVTDDHPASEFAAANLPMLPLKGRYMRPRSVEVGQQPEKILSRNTRRLGAYVFNNGSILEFQLELPSTGAGLLAQAAFVDSAGPAIPPYIQSSYKSLVFQVDTALTWVGAGQAKAQLIVARQPFPARSGAATTIGGNNNNFAKGATVNFGGAGVITLAAGIFVFSPTDMADLQWQWPVIGLELQFPAALTGGAGRVFLEVPGGPQLLIGEEMAISSQSGDRGAAWPIMSGAAPQFIQDDGEVWAVAGPGGTVDCRIWEVWREAPVPPTGG